MEDYRVEILETQLRYAEEEAQEREAYAFECGKEESLKSFYEALCKKLETSIITKAILDEVFEEVQNPPIAQNPPIEPEKGDIEFDDSFEDILPFE